MKRICVALLFILSQDGVFATKGMYYFGKKQSWLKAIEACQSQRGTSIPYMEGIRTVLDKHNVTESVWTSDYLLIYGSEKMCGFRYMVQPSDETGQVYLGDCNGNRSYICWNAGTSSAEIRQGSYYDAIAICNVVYLSSMENFASGYYWVKYTKTIRKMAFYDNNRTADLNQFQNINPFKCGAYSIEAGLYFRECNDDISSFCHFASSETSTEKASLSTSAEDPTTSIGVKTQSIDQSERTDVGKVVGLSVGICVALICGIILNIYVSRRYKCWKTTENENTKSPDVSYSRDQVRFHINNSYEEKENAATKNSHRNANISEKNNASKVTSAPVYAVVNKDKVRQNKLERNEMSSNNINKQGDSREDTVYSFAKETNMYINTNKGCKGNSMNNDEYDVSGNVKGKSQDNSNNVYNCLGNEEYNTVENVKGGYKFDNVYSHTQMQRESNYASSLHVSNSAPCDNVYNHLS